MKCIISGHYPAVTSEEVSKEIAKFEFLMLGLRTKYGVSAKEYEKQFGSKIGEDFPIAVKKSLQYLESDGDRLKIKDEYLYVQNSILMPFMEEIPEEEK